MNAPVAVIEKMIGLVGKDDAYLHKLAKRYKKDRQLTMLVDLYEGGEENNSFIEKLKDLCEKRIIEAHGGTNLSLKDTRHLTSYKKRAHDY